jgi:methylthioribose-1-phosphate isomerase
MTLDPNVQVALVSAGGVVTAAFMGVLVELVRRQGTALAEVREHAQEAREQVSNTHSTNLRDDLDRVISGLDRVLEGQAEHSRDIRELRSELSHERSERLAVSERLDTHIAASVPTP